jgi:hypothetical protein
MAMADGFCKVSSACLYRDFKKQGDLRLKRLVGFGTLPRISIAAQHEASHPGGAAGFQSMVTSISMPLTGLPGALDAH